MEVAASNRPEVTKNSGNEQNLPAKRLAYRKKSLGESQLKFEMQNKWITGPIRIIEKKSANIK